MTGQKIAPLVLAQAAALERIAKALTPVVVRLVRDFGGWYSTAEITRWAAQLAAVAESGQRATAATTDAYLTRAASATTGKVYRPAGTIDVSGLRKNITHPGVYGRLADQYRYEVSIGHDEAQVLEHVVTRAESLVDTDLQLAMRAQEQATLKATHAEGWRRVLHPELVSSNAKSGKPGDVCGMCVAASDRVYHVGTLKEMHGGCRCSVAGIYGGVDPGHDINRADLERIYRDAGNTTARIALFKTRYVVHQHAELGPVLGERGASWRGPKQVADDARGAA